MTWTDSITKRINQVDPRRNLNAFELAYDLGFHLEVEPFFVPSEDLADFINFWYAEFNVPGGPDWTSTDLARGIMREFKLHRREPGGK